MTPDETIAQQAPQDNPKWFGPSEWLDQLMRCQNGDTTCMRTLQIIERETVSMGWVHEQHANLLALCHAIERLPAGEQQTVLSIQASAIAQEMQRVIQFVYAEQDRPKAANVAGVSIEDGKYTIQMDGDGRLRCLRYGQEWRDLTGDKMALAFAQEVQSLRADLAREKERADSAEKRLAEIAGSTIRVVLTRREYDEYLSLKARADALEKELGEAKQQIAMDTVRFKEMQDAGFATESRLAAPSPPRGRKLPMQPTHRLKVLNKFDDARTEVGAGWLNADGSLSITLNPCVVLTRDTNIVITLFPIDRKQVK